MKKKLVRTLSVMAIVMTIAAVGVVTLYGSNDPEPRGFNTTITTNV